MKRVIVVGAGPAGLIAAYAAAEGGNSVLLLDANAKTGKKLYITGKGRCNLTNDLSPAEFCGRVVSNSKFMFSSLSAFSPRDTVSFFESRGVRLKTERGGRVFPASDKASDVTACLERACRQAGAEIRLNERVREIRAADGSINTVVTEGGEYAADAVVVCTGGLSYPATGSTGDGYAFARALGHTVVPLRPSLVGLETEGAELKALQGLSLKNVKLNVLRGRKTVFSELGEMLFTHFGISGPLVLSASALVNRLPPEETEFYVDLKPGMDEATLDRRILRDFGQMKNKRFENSLGELLPKSLIPVIVARSGISADRQVNAIRQEERKRLAEILKKFTVKVVGLRPVEEGIVTAGGVNCAEINPRTMESKLVKGLYFAGEVLDVDAFTGGFNIQIALSTGMAAGRSI